jgi:distribution and morphology protein 31
LRKLLSTTNGFFPRLRLRINYFLLGPYRRKWRFDDFLALFSWIFVGNTVFILLGTTTFVSLLVTTLNSLQFQEFVALKLSKYLTDEMGIKVTFETAIIPIWKDGKIRFKNVPLKLG